MAETPFIDYEQAIELLGKMTDAVHDSRLSKTELDAFEDMASRDRLSLKQLLWVQGVALRLSLLEEPNQNQWSARTLQERERIRGRDVPTPVILNNRPLKPPGRA